MFVLKRMVAVAVTAFALAACSESTSPDTVDTGALADDVADMTALLESNAAYQSMQTLSWHFPYFGATATLRAAMPAAPRLLTGGRLVAPAARPRASRPTLSPEDINALFPIDVLGKTFVWNTSTSQYEPTGPTGAPANGIRIVIYTVNPTNGEPNVPLQSLGFLELTDESNAQADRLGVLLTLGNTTIADYLITAIEGTTSLRLTAAGFITGSAGTGRVDFNLMTYDDYTAGSNDFEYTLIALGGGEIFVDIHENGDGSGSGLIRVTRGENSVEITFTQTTSSATGQVKFNGTVVANITQTGENQPVFTGANGRNLSQQQQQELGLMLLGVFELIFVTLFGILAPAFVVF